MKRTIIQKSLIIIGIAAILAILLIVFCYWRVENVAKDKTYTSVNGIPYNEVGLLLGTNPQTRTGKTNLYFTYRINATEKLYKAGKIKYILISGDN